MWREAYPHLRKILHCMHAGFLSSGMLLSFRGWKKPTNLAMLFLLGVYSRSLTKYQNFLKPFSCLKFLHKASVSSFEETTGRCVMRQLLRGENQRDNLNKICVENPMRIPGEKMMTNKKVRNQQGCQSAESI